METDDSGPAAAPPEIPAERSSFTPDPMEEEMIFGNFNFHHWLETAADDTSSSASPFGSSGLSPLFELPDNPEPETDSPIDNPQLRDHPESSNLLIHSGSNNTLLLSSVKERLSCALRQIKESQKDSEVLVQIWVPVDEQGRRVLTTCGQPFWMDSNCQRLTSYRSVSMAYQFSTEVNSREAPGLPGRVFIGKVPEWSPDVRYFSRDEYPRVNYAQQFDVRGTIALPIFDKGSGNCMGVVEVVRTTEKINYSADLESICNVLQAVDLQSSDVHSVPRLKMGDDSHQPALPEIRRVLQVVCETHRLPLAQTWMPCFQQGKSGSRHSEDNYRDCVSTLDDACFVRDTSMWGFHRACSEHHLLRGQGVAGKAFTTNQPCYSPDITSFSKTAYPLWHHARMVDLRAAVAIRLHCVHTGNTDFVLEFFLPINCIGDEEQRVMLNSLPVTIQQVCQNLRVVTDQELENEARLQNQISNLVLDEPRVPSPSSDPLELQPQEVLLSSKKMSDVKRSYNDSNEGISDHKDSATGESGLLSAGKAAGKRRTKTEKTISLDVLRQYFAGSLKDAAKNLGVCPTTLKRICRQHGINRWPSRKIKKVGRSLKKLQVVIDSVHGAEGAFHFSSVYENFTKASGSGNLFIGSSNMSPLKLENQADASNLQQQHDARVGSHTSASNSMSSSSCSQTSNSIHYCPSAPPIIKQENKVEADKTTLLKKVNSHSELPLPVLEAPKPLMKSQSLEVVRFESRSLSPPYKSRSDLMRVKAMFGEEKVRFRLQPTWTYDHLRQEIAKRFNLGTMEFIDLKYLDDDSEWVLLTCDADLQECVEVYKSSGAQTIKVTVHRAAPRNTGYSLGRTGLS